MKKIGIIFIILCSALVSKAQPPGCILKPPQINIHFGTNNARDINSEDLYNYRRVSTSCPSDGYYSYASYTSECFNDDWHTLPEDHTPGDAGGNMLLVNAARYPGAFLRTPVSGLKSNTIYELGLWLMNLCKPTKKCPFVLLPELNIRLETPEGKIVASIVTGELPRLDNPRWIQHRAFFTTPASTSTLMLVMIDKNPSGCGNDFALDDITFRECVKDIKQVTSNTPKNSAATKQAAATKPPPNKVSNPQPKKVETAGVVKPKRDSASKVTSSVTPNQKINPATPLVLKTRENALVRRIEIEAGEIKMDIYDNGDIDGDTVSIYHNNKLIRSHLRLSQKPISISIGISPSESHHEIIMVAENLGSIPPNTSIMIITTVRSRYELFISSTEQKNAKVVFDLKR
ncbi:MAG TPA: hypothetical protein VF144_06095 [Chitinophagaceae bacterium]